MEIGEDVRQLDGNLITCMIEGGMMGAGEACCLLLPGMRHGFTPQDPWRVAGGSSFLLEYV